MGFCILADDLTGALDSAVRFTQRGISSAVLLSGPWPDAEAVAVNTGSRNMQSEEAYDAVASALKAISCPVYKKIDSLMRGNAGREIDALLDSGRYEAAFVAPAYPANSRTVRNGIISYPGGEIDAYRIISRQSKHKSALVAADMMPAFFRDERILEGFMREGCRIFFFDAESDDQLQQIADYALSSSLNAVLCGSAGLAGFIGGDECPENIQSTVSAGYVFFGIGSYSSVSDGQICELISAYDMKKTGQEGRLESFSSIGGLIRLIHTDHEENIIIEDSSIAEGIASGIISSLRDERNVCLVLSGGTTAEAVLNRLGAGSLRVLGSVEEGIPISRICGGEADGCCVITKSGSFGNRRTLLKCAAAAGGVE